MTAKNTLEKLVKDSSSSEFDSSICNGASSSEFDSSICNGALFTQGKGNFFVLDGHACLIPSTTTYDLLFTSVELIAGRDMKPTMKQLWDNMLNKIPKGPAINEGATLIKGDGLAVYLFVNKKKHWITSPSVIDYCGFDRKKIKTHPQLIVDAIPVGSDINYVAK